MAALLVFMVHLPYENIAVLEKHDVHMARTWWHVKCGDGVIKNQTLLLNGTVVFSKQQQVS